MIGLIIIGLEINKGARQLMGSVAILVSEILDLVSPKDFGMT